MTTTDHSQAVAFARISAELTRAPDWQHTLQRLVDLAVETIKGCELAGVSLCHRDGRVETPAATSPLVEQADSYQYQLRQGPCLDAIWSEDTCVIEDLGRETRWPQWAPKAAALGIRSVVSLRLSTQADVVGGLNLYSTQVAAYDEDALTTARVYAMHAATALVATAQLDGLRTAMETRHRIGMAQGILMQRFGLDEERAFQLLRRRSQDTNTKLRDVAAQVVSGRSTR